MGSRRLALIGTTEGPCIDISRVLYPAIKIIGLKEGEVTLTVHNPHQRRRYTFLSCGVHRIDDGFNWAIVSASKKQQSLVCEIISAKVA